MTGKQDGTGNYDSYQRADAVSKTLRKTFSANLEKLLAAKKIGRAEFCQRIGISNASLSGYKNGTVLPPTEKLILIAELFGVTFANLVLMPLGEESQDGQPAKKQPAQDDKPIDPCYCGTFILYYFDASQPQGDDRLNNSQSIHYGLVSIKEMVSAVGQRYYPAVALSGIASRDLPEIKAALDENSELGIPEILENVCAPYQGRFTDFYTGHLRINKPHICIQLKTSQRDLLISMKNVTRDANRDVLRTCIGTLSTLTKDESCSPVSQKVLVSSIFLDQPQPGCELDDPSLLFDTSKLAAYLEIGHAQVDLNPLKDDFTRFIKQLYTTPAGDVPYLDALPESYRDSLIMHFLEDSFAQITRNNTCRYIRLADSQASEFYQQVARLAHSQGLWLAGGA
ncbi:MAG: helix-turn-helix domain-containing protein [Coriobacteriales bacterium]|nr:helix-turn-helix domain-containing protein [Coriobacteriales bacterium]